MFNFLTVCTEPRDIPGNHKGVSRFSCFWSYVQYENRLGRHDRMLDTRNMHTTYEKCIPERSKVTCEVKIWGQMYAQKEKILDHTQTIVETDRSKTIYHRSLDLGQTKETKKWIKPVIIYILNFVYVSVALTLKYTSFPTWNLFRTFFIVILF